MDDLGRRVLFGWLREERSSMEIQKAGWAGVQSIPRILSLDDKMRLQMQPTPEMERIRGRLYSCKSSSLDRPISINIEASSLDITVEIEPGNSETCGLSLIYSTTPEEAINILYDTLSQHIVIRKLAESPDTAGKTLPEAPHPLAPGEVLRFRILLDGSVVEIIANERTSLSTRFYPTSTNGIEICAFGEGARLRSLDTWEMQPIFGNSTTKG
jgi:beta-fructofuranosidase